jgi:hypothetical protein
MTDKAGFLENSHILAYDGSRDPVIVITKLRASHVLKRLRGVFHCEIGVILGVDAEGAIDI